MREDNILPYGLVALAFCVATLLWTVEDACPYGLWYDWSGIMGGGRSKPLPYEVVAV